MDSENTKSLSKKISKICQSENCKFENCESKIDPINLYFCKQHLPDSNTNICQAPKDCRYKPKEYGFCGHHLPKQPKADKILKTHKLKLQPNPQQKQILKQWFGIGRLYYNQTINHLQTPGTKSNLINSRPIIKSKLDLITYTKSVPDKIKQGAIEDACKAINESKRRYIKDGKFRKHVFRTKKDPSQSLYIPADSYGFKDSKTLKIFITKLGLIGFKGKFRNLEITSASRLVMKHNSVYYLHIPVEIEAKKGREGIVALDPGERSFMTSYSQEGIKHYAIDNRSRLHKLNNIYSNLQSKRDKLTNKLKPKIKITIKNFNGVEKKITPRIKNLHLRRLNIQMDRLKAKVSHLVDQIHKKVALDLVRNYDHIILPVFRTQNMVSKKLNKKVKTNLLCLSHYKFQQFLIHKAREYQAKVYIVDEAYTTKTCGRCGRLNNPNGSVYKCKSCELIVDRDVNGSRNIFIKHVSL